MAPAGSPRRPPPALAPRTRPSLELRRVALTNVILALPRASTTSSCRLLQHHPPSALAPGPRPPLEPQGADELRLDALATAQPALPLSRMSVLSCHGRRLKTFF